jgi:hypothetical protein
MALASSNQTTEGTSLPEQDDQPLQPPDSRVSICTVTHNRQHLLPLLEECIRQQTFPHHRLEWVIIDDSDNQRSQFSPDPKLNISTTYIHIPERLPLGAKRNLSHQYCRGDFIVYMDDDDWYPPTRIAHAVEKLSNSDALIAGSTCLPILLLPEEELWLAGPYGKNHATANTFAFKRSLLSETQYDPSSVIAEEKHFLKNYTIPMVQLEPKHTILCIGHSQNTFDKRKLKKQNNKVFRRVANPANQREALRAIAHRYAKAMETEHPRPELILVSGPWGSGTTAVTAMLKALGIQAPGPYFMTNDPRTPTSLEMTSFRDLTRSLIDEATLSRRANPDQIRKAINDFSQELAQTHPLQTDKPLLLKLPIAALMLDEISQAFRTKLVVCLRNLESIEASRIRRGWPTSMGRPGAEILYGAIFTHIINHANTKAHLIHYEKAINSPEREARLLASFCRLEPTMSQLDQAVAAIRNHIT